MGREYLNQILEEDIILLSVGESDTELMEPEEDLNITRPYSIIDELMDGQPNYHTENQTFTGLSTIFTTSYPLASMTNTTIPSTINTIIPISTHITSHGNTQQNTTAAHIQITTPAPPLTTISKPSTHLPTVQVHHLNTYLSTFFSYPVAPIIKLVKYHLKKQAKIKKANKNKTKNKKATTSKLRFTQRLQIHFSHPHFSSN